MLILTLKKLKTENMSEMFYKYRVMAKKEFAMKRLSKSMNNSIRIKLNCQHHRLNNIIRSMILMDKTQMYEHNEARQK